jgi:hypothetical protein
LVYQGLEKKPLIKITWPSRLGVDTAGQLLLIGKRELLKKPIGNNLDVY